MDQSEERSRCLVFSTLTHCLNLPHLLSYADDLQAAANAAARAEGGVTAP